MADVCVVIPTVRKISKCWADEFKTTPHGITVILVGDDKNTNPTFPHDEFIGNKQREDWLHLFMKKSRIQAYHAYDHAVNEYSPDMIVTIDDDTLPYDNFIDTHWKALNSKTFDFCNVLHKQNVFPRGFPLQERRGKKNIVLNQGLWSGDLDINAYDKMSGEIQWQELLDYSTYIVPKNEGVTISSMNIAFKPEIVPALFAPQLGRYDDIWSGMILKRICDHLNKRISYGKPFLIHTQAPRNLYGDALKEAEYQEINDKLWSILQSIPLKNHDWFDCYKEIAFNKKIPEILAKHMRNWVYFNERSEK